jgi:uncharacterized protein
MVRTKKLESEHGRRSFAVILETGDEAMQSLRTVADQLGMDGAHFTAIGAFSEVTLGYWEWTTKTYKRIPVHEQVEVLALTGNIAIAPDGTRQIHAHIVIGKADGTAHGGHLLEGRVRPTMELMLTELPKHLRRRIDPHTGLPLLDTAL